MNGSKMKMESDSLSLTLYYFINNAGKHHVEFRMVNEKRWLLMKKITFYIVQRPRVVTMSEGSQPGADCDGSEFKDFEVDESQDGLAPIESDWIYVDDISEPYVFAQSVLFKIYGNGVQETGHLTKGHVCLTDIDRKNAQVQKGSLLYGELLPRGVNKALNPTRLDGSTGSNLFDLGMGTGKIVIQAFLQFSNLKYVYGVELSAGRYLIAEEAALAMVAMLGVDNFKIKINPGKSIIVREISRAGNLYYHSSWNERAATPSEGDEAVSEKESEPYTERVLHMECGNMFDVENMVEADIVMMETDFPVELHTDLNTLICQMKERSRLLTYLDLRKLALNRECWFKQVKENKQLSDRYPTSWSVQRGHHFFLWSKRTEAGGAL